MKKLLSALLAVFAVSAHAQQLLPYIESRPAPTGAWPFCEEILQKGQPKKELNQSKIDVRSCDISAWNFSNYTKDELADILRFDSLTQFPPKNKLPKGFNPKKILENGKNPGLKIRALHKKGIDGRGVSVGIIDQNLLVDHPEYKDNVVWYQEDESWKEWKEPSSMHAPAVASILVGKNVGVAPKARLFFLAGVFAETPDGLFDATPLAVELEHFSYINSLLPEEQKVRVISISRGFAPDDMGADKWAEAKKKLESEGVAVFTTNDVTGLSRVHSLNNPDKLPYCRPPYWFAEDEYEFLGIAGRFAMPGDFRTTAAPNTPDAYVYYAGGGLSWVVPYVAGLYALGLQVYPPLTKEIFKEAWEKTALEQDCEFNGVKFKARGLAQPEKLIQYLQQLNKK